MKTEINWDMVHAIQAAADQIQRAANTIEEAQRKMACMFEPVYGGSALRLIELMEAQENKKP